MEEKKRIAPVHVRKILADKSPRLSQFIPRFITNYISRVIHEDEINAILTVHGDKYDLEFVDAVIKDFNVTLVVKDEENIPAKGRFIFAGNHPLGGFDGMLLMHFLGRKYPGIRFLSNDILMNVQNLAGLLLPINKHGSHSRDAAIMIDHVMQSQNPIVTFPAGLVSRKINGQIRDLEWKKNFIQKAVKYERDIIPFHVTGRNTEWFYKLARLRKFLRIKWNLEMFYLPDETFRHKNKTFTITFGKPISYTTFDQSKKAEEWAAWIKERVYSLPAGSNR
jgi:putative hemolysin